MRVNRFDCPGYQEAVERENAIRDAAFLDCEANIFGLKIRQMTLEDFLILDGLENAFVTGGVVTPSHVTTFLWVMLPRRWRGFRAVWFGLRCRRLPFEPTAEALRRFISDTFQDSPGGPAGRTVAPYFCFAAEYVHELASAYGWGESEILRMPFKRMFQYLKIIRAERDAKRGKKPILFNPSDRFISQHLREKNAALKAAGGENGEQKA